MNKVHVLSCAEQKKEKQNFNQSKDFAVVSRKSVWVQQVSELVVPSDFKESRGNTVPYVHMNCPSVTAWRVWVQGLHWQATCWQTHTCSDTFCRPWLRKTQWLVFLEERHLNVFALLAVSPHVASYLKCAQPERYEQSKNRHVGKIWAHKMTKLN